MDVPTSNMLWSDDDSRNLRKLLQIFSSVVSLEEIASAYSQAGRDIDMAGEIICNLQGSTSGSSTSESKDVLESASETSSEMSDDTILRSSAPKTKKSSASMGTVSGVIGAEYARMRPSTYEPCTATKPVKLMSSEFPESEIWEETNPSDNAEIMHNDVENFLLTMLGVGFQLGKDVIREVVGTCGYDVKKSMKKMLDMSESTLDIGADALSVSAQTHKDKCQVLKTLQSQGISQYRDLAGSGEAGSRNGSELPKRGTDRGDLQKEVLQALFAVPERYEEPPRRIIHKKKLMGTRMPEKLVVEPPSDMYTKECKTATVKLEVKGDEHVNTEDSYQVLREAVQEYSITMKEYYKAAVDAFANGRYDLAYKLLDHGNFFWKKAQEANEKSAEKLTETRNVEEVISLDLQDYTTKEAIRLVELHLTRLSGIPSIQYLKLILGVNDVSTKKGARKQLQIKKLLEGNSITWTEEENGRILVIRVDEISPKRLSFSK